MAIGDKIVLPDKRTLDLAKNKVDNIYAVVPTSVSVPEPSPLDKNYIADKSTLDSMKTKLDSLPIFTPDGTASSSEVLSGKTFLSNSITKKTGTMPNRGAVNSTITTQGGTYTLPSGYHSGTGKIAASFANLTANNIKKGVNVGGVVGTLPSLIEHTETRTGYLYAKDSWATLRQYTSSSKTDYSFSFNLPIEVTKGKMFMLKEAYVIESGNGARWNFSDQYSTSPIWTVDPLTNSNGILYGHTFIVSCSWGTFAGKSQIPRVPFGGYNTDSPATLYVTYLVSP